VNTEPLTNSSRAVEALLVGRAVPWPEGDAGFADDNPDSLSAVLFLSLQVCYRVEWAKFQERERKKEEEEKEKERVAYAQIDWHDFVVVETVDFQPNEQGRCGRRGPPGGSREP
jgi:hypothetical protein